MSDLRLQPQSRLQRTPRLIKSVFVQFEEGFAQPFERFPELSLALGFQRLAELPERPPRLERMQVKRHMFT